MEFPLISEVSAHLVVELCVEDKDLLVLAMSLNFGAWWQSPSNVLLLIVEHVRFGGCQAVGCGDVVVGINAILLDSKVASEHSECRTPVLALGGNVTHQ